MQGWKSVKKRAYTQQLQDDKSYYTLLALTSVCRRLIGQREGAMMPRHLIPQTHARDPLEAIEPIGSHGDIRSRRAASRVVVSS